MEPDSIQLEIDLFEEKQRREYKRCHPSLMAHCQSSSTKSSTPRATTKNPEQRSLRVPFFWSL